MLVDSSADGWLGILAGRNTWQDPDRPLTVGLRCAAGAQVLALAATASTLAAWHSAVDRSPGHPANSTGVIALGVGIVLAAVGPARTVLGRSSPPRPLWLNIAIRWALMIALVTGVYAVAPRWAALMGWPLGVAIGVDIALTAYAIGSLSSPWRWWVTFMTSPAHFGIVGGLVGIAIVQTRTDTFATAFAAVVPVYVSTHLVIAIACLTVGVCDWLFDVERLSHRAIRADTTRDEHRRSAHWLHDDICAQLRLVTLRVQRGDMSQHDVISQLDDLDFALRLRQLDELLESGSVRLAEVLQPFVRNAQSRGVTVERVPSYDTASTVVDRATGQVVRHAAAVLTSNALNAGATRLAVDIEVDAAQIRIAVSDDAGGFDRTCIQPGRGLWSLEQELGDGSVHITPTERGSMVAAVVARSMESR